jgi:hypothetical protein
VARRRDTDRHLQPRSGSIRHDRDPHVTHAKCRSYSLVVDPPRRRSLKSAFATSTWASIFVAQGRYPQPPRANHARQRRRPTRSMASIAITHRACRAQIPIAPAARPPATSRGFLPWRLSDAGPKPRRSRPRPSQAGIRNPSQEETFVRVRQATTSAFSRPSKPRYTHQSRVGTVCVARGKLVQVRTLCALVTRNRLQGRRRSSWVIASQA